MSTINGTVETLRAGSVGVAATVGLTVGDVVAYLTAGFIIMQAIAVAPKMFEGLVWIKNKLSGKETK